MHLRASRSWAIPHRKSNVAIDAYRKPRSTKSFCAGFLFSRVKVDAVSTFERITAQKDLTRKGIWNDGPGRFVLQLSSTGSEKDKLEKNLEFFFLQRRSRHVRRFLLWLGGRSINTGMTSSEKIFQ